MYRERPRSRKTQNDKENLLQVQRIDNIRKNGR